jgi:NADP-dependent aldehyde dehydrogenase
MELTGQMLIGASAVRGEVGQLVPLNAATGEALSPSYGGGGQAEVDRACTMAAQAFDAFRETAPAQRAALLDAIGQGLLDLGPALIERASLESGLPRTRIEGERGRTVGQLGLFAQLLRSGRWAGVTIDTALPERTPPRPDLRLRRIAVGPVAVFGASNFPLAFSVAGGDTASALAAGCPVVVKAHPAHLGTSEMVGRVIQAAVKAASLPEGVFSLLVGEGNAIGEALVRHPSIQAVGFTGSRSGGMALCRIAAARPQPIPVYAEMSSVNPMFLLPQALAQRADALARGHVDSLVLGVGQFCTNPGLAIGIAGPHFDRFREAAARALAAKEAGVMLTRGIHGAYDHGVQKLGSIDGVQLLALGGESRGACHAQPALFAADAERFLDEPQLAEEIFGPAGVLIACRDAEQMLQLAERLDGQLTATLQMETDDLPLARRLLPVLERKAGRILANGFPTGVEVSHAMVHGGPWPATSDPRSTSVGAGAIDRFVRPVCYQALPDALLPPALQAANPLGLPRLVDGQPEAR